MLAATAAFLTLVGGAGAAMVGIYRNGMETDAQRKQVAKLSGESCGQAGSESTLRIVVGKRTRECAYRTPVVGRDLEISAVERLLSGTPAPLQRKAFLSVGLRTDAAGAGYRLLVYPLQRKAQLVKTLSDGATRYLQIEKDLATVKGVDQANQLRLRAVNVLSGADKGKGRILAFVGGTLIADVIDEAAQELEGRSSSFSVGATSNAKGLIGSVDDVVIRVPSPFQ